MMPTRLSGDRSLTGPTTQSTPAQTQTPSDAPSNAGKSSKGAIFDGLQPLSRAQPQASSASTSRRRASLQETAPPREAPEARALRQEGVHAAVSGYFMRHVTDGENTNRAALTALVESRMQGLMEMGETQESIETTFANGRRHDIGAEGARGFCGSVPFGLASRLLDTTPAIGDTVVSGLNALPVVKHAPDAFKGGVAGGLVSGGADHIGSQALAPAMKDIQWLSSSAEDLEAPMAEAKARADAGMLRAVEQNATAIQTFTVRNVIRGIVGPAITAAGRVAAATQTDSLLAAIGSPLSGAGFNLLNRHFAEQDHRIGPEYLLGRADWQQQYRALKGATWKGAVANGAGRVAKAVINTVDATLSAPNTILSAPGIVTNAVVLGGGLGAASLATAAAGALAKKHGAGEAGVVAAEHAARTVSSAGVFATWTTAAIVTQPVVDGMRDLSNAAGDLAKKGVSTVVYKSAAAIGSTAEQGNNYAAPKLRSAGDAAIRAGQEAFASVGTTLGNVRAAAGNGVNAASSAVNTGLGNLFRRTRAAPTQDLEQNAQDIPLGDRNV